MRMMLWVVLMGVLSVVGMLIPSGCSNQQVKCSSQEVSLLGGNTGAVVVRRCWVATDLETKVSHKVNPNE
jgi:hypothetical protein